ncbi:MAG: Hsp20/alpha crystallin family protein [Desulfobacterales bacterium]|nr:Hsp20/alpha crystallin family protein [Desulfobacterales bacterium]
MLWTKTTGWPAWDWTNPFDELDRIRKEMDRLTEGLARGFFAEPAAGVFPLVNVTEGRDNFYVRAELPGIKADELDISVTADTLSISGERTIPIEDQKVRYHRRERERGKFRRSITLPVPVYAAKVEARCVDGILMVVLPKVEEARPKQIPVKIS